jgi:Fe-S oxidoreductase
MANARLGPDVAGKIEKDVYTCASCGYCRFNCPVLEQVGFERASARGRMLLVKRVLEGKLDFGPEIIDLLFACAQCAGCSEMCPTGIDYCEIITELRREAARRGLLPESQVMGRDIIAEHGNPFAQPQSERGDWVPKTIEAGRKAKDLYFIGCSASYGSNRLPKSALVAVEAAEHEMTVLGDKEQCCGFPLFRMGEDERARALVEKNIASFKELGVERVVASCPGCFKTLRHELPKEFTVLHMEELLAELVKEGRIEFIKPLKKRAIYSDGCDLGRHSGVYDAPRDVLRAIPELELMEFDYNREQAACCGGPVASHDPDMAHNIAAEKVREAVDKGVDMIVTSCPMCFVNLKEGAKVADVRIDVQALPMLLPKVIKKRKKDKK